MNRRRLARATTAVLTAVLVAGVGVVIRQHISGPMTVTALFTKATSIYPGDTVQVAGVEVGRVESIDAEGTQAKMVLEIRRGVQIPADAKALIVSQNLVAARYVELTPAYEDNSGPTMTDGAVIPLNRTAVPVEWDEVKDQLMRLAVDLGPHGDPASAAPTSVAGFLDSAANAMAGNGDKLRQTLAQLSGASRVLADGGGNIVDIIKNLEVFVHALAASNTQIVQFEDRFATLTSVLDEGRSDLDAAVTQLSDAVGEVRRFIAGSRDQTAEQIQRLSNVTQNLVDHKTDLENVLHVAPNALANAYNIYNPDTGSVMGSFALTPFSNPIALICGAIGAIENKTAPEAAKLCQQYLGPAMGLLNMNGLPFPVNPFLAPSADPANIVYSDQRLAPGGAGPAPVPPEVPPTQSAYQPQGTSTGVPGLLLPSGPASNSAGDVPAGEPQEQPSVVPGVPQP